MSNPAPSNARQIVEKLLAEEQGSMRFDLNCRVEVWVTQDDIEDDRRARKIRNGAVAFQPRSAELWRSEAPGNAEEKITALKNLAQTIAAEKLREAHVGGIEITCDSLALSDVNVDRINWAYLAQSDAERRAAEEAENAAEDARWAEFRRDERP